MRHTIYLNILYLIYFLLILYRTVVNIILVQFRNKNPKANKIGTANLKIFILFNRKR